ncbi:hypothetical protein E1B28_008632 [Marasmius oreades]|uniref:Uncharacterized protein n=1 Tax=Marasmius oreades TaxID=181124 RepID=A0A9P7USB4_9AGAR|nr:uncharacterized protein E1B28_008632 [Marasmius oreades]KAG7092268.1 hypothetical protein E1B28_008632 [Marasmius oreades]
MATTIEMPMNTAHQHAANAEDHSSNGLLIPSAEEHLKAAEAYMAAIARTNDDSTRRTLQMLHNEHKRSHLELQRKISRLKEEGKDPNEPQKPEVQRAPSSNSVSTFTQPMSSPSPARPLMESTTVEESFMVLGGQRSDPGDAFNQFWTIMQGMLENLSQPVAFATAPLGTSSEPSRPEEHHSSDTDYTDAEERLSSRLSRKLKLGGKSVKSQLTAGGRGSPAIETSTQEGDFDDDFSDEGDDLSESFLVIPSEATMRALKQENIALKGQVGLLQHRLEATERVLRLRKEQDHYLRDSILQASKEAQRAMGASLLGQRGPVDLGPVNLQSPSLPQPGINTPREAQYARRVKELEEELRNMRIENDRNKVMIAKFRERWDKLKESAKRKKVSKAAAVASKTGIQERILEEPEVEEEQI